MVILRFKKSSIIFLSFNYPDDYAENYDKNVKAVVVGNAK